MMGKTQVHAPKLFYVGVNLEERIPQDNPYRQIARAVRFDHIRGLVAHCYGDRGHESIDPVVLLKLMLILFIENVRVLVLPFFVSGLAQYFQPILIESW